jgi:hypothetical protein
MPPARDGTGAYGKLPVMPEVHDKAERKKIKIIDSADHRTIEC